MKNLEQLQFQLLRISEHRVVGAEDEIRALYKELLKDLRGFLGETYGKYADKDGRLYRTTLSRKRAHARFMEDVGKHLGGLSTAVIEEIYDTVRGIYQLNYDGLISAVKNSATDVEVKKALREIGAVTPEVIKSGVEAPLDKLTLKKSLEKHRREIVYDIKKDITTGLMNGDRYSTVADRIKDTLQGDYSKSIRVVRTETHRVREAGIDDSANAILEELDGSAYTLAKKWKSMSDGNVRGDHEQLDGQTVPVDGYFQLNGMKAKSPGGFGVAGQDINCRCIELVRLIKRDKLNQIIVGS